MHDILGTTTRTLLALGVAAGVLGWAAGPAQAQDRNITIVLSEEPDSLDGCNSSVSSNGRVVHNNIGEGLTQFDNTTGKVVPRLATSWKQVDKLTWQFELREGVTFHDGTKLDAESAARSINRSLSPNLDCNIRTLYFGNITVKAEVVDDYTINLSTDVYEPILPNYMTWVMLVSPNTPMDKLTLTTIGTGPYVLENYQPGQEIVATRNPDWWGPTPEVERVRYVFRSESTVRGAMITNGEADLTEDISPQDVVENGGSFRDVSYANMETAFLRIDTMIPPLDDKRLRIALNLAVDREGMLGTIFPAESIPATNLVAPAVSGHNPNLTPWPYDPDRARKLVAEAKADGVDVDKEITLWGRTNLYANSTESMEALLAMWSDVGFNMKLQMLEVGQWLKIHGKPYPEDRGPSIIQTRHNNQGGDAVFTAHAKWACDGSRSAMCDPTLDEKIDKATQLVGEEREKVWQEVARSAFEDTVADVIQYHLVGFSRISNRIDYTPNFMTLNAIEVSTISFR